MRFSFEIKKLRDQLSINLLTKWYLVVESGIIFNIFES